MREARRAAGISVSKVSFSAGGVRALNDVSFSAEPGGIVFVIGRNGAGKSTLFKCIAGIIKNYAGKIDIGGTPSSSLSARDRARLVAYVPQWSPGDVPYTVSEFMEMSRYPWKTVSGGVDDRRAIDEAVSLAGIGGLVNRGLSSLSGGERQKVMIAAAIAQETGIMLMDEPTTYLDYACQAEIMDVMAGVNRERGVTMIVVTHDVNLAMSLAGHVVAMSSGRVIWAGPPSGLFEPDRLEAIYGARFRVYSPGSMGEGAVMLPERGSGLARPAVK